MSLICNAQNKQEILRFTHVNTKPERVEGEQLLHHCTGLFFLMLAACLNTALYNDSHKMKHACKLWLTACISQYLHALTIIILVSFYSLSEYRKDDEFSDNVDFLLLRKSLKKMKKKRKKTQIVGTESCQDWAPWEKKCNHQKCKKNQKKFHASSVTSQDGGQQCKKMREAVYCRCCCTFMYFIPA